MEIIQRIQHPNLTLTLCIISFPNLYRLRKRNPHILLGMISTQTNRLLPSNVRREIYWWKYDVTFVKKPKINIHFCVSFSKFFLKVCTVKGKGYTLLNFFFQKILLDKFCLIFKNIKFSGTEKNRNIEIFLKVIRIK